MVELGEEHNAGAISEEDVELIVDELGVPAVAVAVGASAERFMVASW